MKDWFAKEPSFIPPRNVGKTWQMVHLWMQTAKPGEKLTILTATEQGAATINKQFAFLGGLVVARVCKAKPSPQGAPVFAMIDESGELPP